MFKPTLIIVSEDPGSAVLSSFLISRALIPTSGCIKLFFESAEGLLPSSIPPAISPAHQHNVLFKVINLDPTAGQVKSFKLVFLFLLFFTVSMCFMITQHSGEV